MRDLCDTLRDLDPREDRELIEAFRALIDRIVITDAEDGTVFCEVIGLLGPLTDDADSWGGSMVAEEGLEPPTRGL